MILFSINVNVLVIVKKVSSKGCHDDYCGVIVS